MPRVLPARKPRIGARVECHLRDAPRPDGFRTGAERSRGSRAKSGTRPLTRASTGAVFGLCRHACSIFSDGAGRHTADHHNRPITFEGEHFADRIGDTYPLANCGLSEAEGAK